MTQPQRSLFYSYFNTISFAQGMTYNWNNFIYLWHCISYCVKVALHWYTEKISLVIIQVHFWQILSCNVLIKHFGENSSCLLLSEIVLTFTKTSFLICFLYKKTCFNKIYYAEQFNDAFLRLEKISSVKHDIFKGDVKSHQLHPPSNKNVIFNNSVCWFNL